MKKLIKKIYEKIIRDYFAGQALSGLLSHSGTGTWNLEHRTNESLSKHAYLIADEMMKERGNQ